MRDKQTGRFKASEPEPSRYMPDYSLRDPMTGRYRKGCTGNPGGRPQKDGPKGKKYVNRQERKRKGLYVECRELSQQERDEMAVLQDHRCAVCRTHFDELGRKPCVDHCHETGEVRGLLCLQCNCAIGFAREDSVTLRALADYLDQAESPAPKAMRIKRMLEWWSRTEESA